MPAKEVKFGVDARDRMLRGVNIKFHFMRVLTNSGVMPFQAFTPFQSNRSIEPRGEQYEVSTFA